MNNNKFIKKWERTRKWGQTVYVLISCLTLGVSTFIGAMIAYLFFERVSIENTIGVIIGGSIGGLIGGILRWNSSEEKYKKWTENDPK